VLALLASQRDLGPDIGGSHDGVPFYDGSYWIPDWVAETGLEPVTQRL
jgi:hypothetical protein